MSNNARELEILAIQSIMSNKDGRNVFWRILEQAGLFDDTFDSDPYLHARNAGKRSTGVWLQNELKDVAPGSYLTMLKEHTNE